ncbi:MAG: AAA family ATPase [Candidatus Gastranaerophilales bacterium]|nr:AAA family ATPase [Candidatus Gastranaerophilales bacterium]
MNLSRMKIKKYRQFYDVDICYNDLITILAGPNNSGKTSLVELYRNLFENGIQNIKATDINAQVYQVQKNKLIEILIKSLTEAENKNNFLNKLEEKLSINLIDSIEVQLEISYKENDEITNFADYLMELDDTNKSFYFMYRYYFNYKFFISKVSEDYEKFSEKITTYNQIQEELNNSKDEESRQNSELKQQNIKNSLITKLFEQSFENKFYFCNNVYQNEIELDVTKFKNLFNFVRINADRNLSDEKTNNNYLISKSLIDLISDTQQWKDLLKDTPEKVFELFDNTNIKKEITDNSYACLKPVMQELKSTNGCEIGTPHLELNLTEENIGNLISNSTIAKYQVDDYLFEEQSQGLGYSNLIYIHIQIEKFKKAYDNKLVNFFVIEEPEAHMHPHMQRILIKYLNNYFYSENIQGLITTHSNEIVKVSEIETIRVIRTTEQILKNEIFDLNKFMKDIKKKDMKLFYSLLFKVNYSDLIFANKIIMYEGDTEKMFLERLLQLNKYNKLNSQYISFVQVGGAYSHKYKDILNFLGIKTVIFTDIDYDSSKCSADDIFQSKTTNEGLLSYYTDSINVEKEMITIKNLYEWVQTNPNIKLYFQTKEDGYARTLEEAILNKKLNIIVENKKTKEYWEINKSLLKFKIPLKDFNGNDIGDNIGVRDIVRATSDNKTDFMYSLILLDNEQLETFIPNYIEEGLIWLAQ